MTPKRLIDTTLRTAFCARFFGGLPVLALTAFAALAPCGAQAAVKESDPISITGTSDVYVKFTLTDNVTASKTWTVPAGVTKIDYLVVGGGGGGGGAKNSNYHGGGGGGGAVVTNTMVVSAGQSLTIKVGAGGDGGGGGGGTVPGTEGGDGSESALGDITAIGGGGGGGSTAKYTSGKTGACGGGGGHSNGGTSGGSGTDGVGYAGAGCSYTSQNGAAHGGGGGGVSSPGDAGGDAEGAGKGGGGLSCDITGVAIVYGQGGDGGDGATGVPEKADYGNGGKGGHNSAGGAGGSGVVIIRYTPSTHTYTIDEDWTTPGTDGISTRRIHDENGTSYKVVKFAKSVASWTVPSGVTSFDYLVVGGGGAGGGSWGGGGGAGGFIYRKNINASGTLSIKVGNGGTVASGYKAVGGNGGESSLTGDGLGEPAVANGGGGGGYYRYSGNAGGSGGGAGGSGTGGQAAVSGGAGTDGQGKAGGSSIKAYSICGAGGGGAKTAGGASTPFAEKGGVGGDGLSCDITGSVTPYAGGGGGGTDTGTNEEKIEYQCAGGAGGGGAGAYGKTSASAGEDGLGGGGGGGYGSTTDGNTGGAGGSGVVIIRYALPAAVTYTWNKGIEGKLWNYDANWTPNTGFPNSTDSDIAAFTSDSLVTINTQPQAKRLDITSGRTVTLRLQDGYGSDRTITVADTTNLVTSGSCLVIKGNGSKKLTVAGTTQNWTGGTENDAFFSTLSAGSVLELANNAGYTGLTQFSSKTPGESVTIYAHDGANTIGDVRAYCKTGYLNVWVADGSLSAGHIAGNSTSDYGGSRLVFFLTNATLSAKNIRGYDSTDSKYTNLKFDIQLGASASTATPVVSVPSGKMTLAGSKASYGVNIDATLAPLGTYTILSAGTLSINGAGDPLADDQQPDDPQATSGWTITENTSDEEDHHWSWSVDAGTGRKWTLKREEKAVTLKIENASRSIEGATVTFSNPASGVAYTGAEISPTVTVTLDGGATTLVEGTDYTLTWSSTPLKNAAPYTATITGNGSSYVGTVTPTFIIIPATTTISGLKITSWTTGETPQSPSCTVTPAAAQSSVTYKYYSDAACETEVDPPPTTQVGDYWVRAFVAADENWSAAETPVESAVQFRVRPEGEIKIEVPVPDPVSKPYTGELQYSGIGAASEYTVTDSGAVEFGTYDVTLTLKDPTRYRFANYAEGSTTVPFTITTAQNYWITSPQLTPTAWYKGDEHTLVAGEAKFGDSTKQILWCDAEGNALSPNECPTTAGTYILRVVVPADSVKHNWSEVAYEIGFTIYEPLGVLKIPVPVPAVQYYTGEEQGAAIPVSEYWTVAETKQTNAGTGYTSTLTLVDTENTTWLLPNGSTTTDNQTITWSILQAENEWVTPPAFKDANDKPVFVWAAGSPSPITLVIGTDKFGNVAETDPTELKETAGTYTMTFTVTGTTNYKGLKETLTYVVGSGTTGSADTTDCSYEWQANAGGLWQLANNWEKGTGATYGYPNSEYATALFSANSHGTSDNPITVNGNLANDVRLQGMVVDENAASDITIDMHKRDIGGTDYTKWSFANYTHLNEKPDGYLDNSTRCLLSIAAGKHVTLYDGVFDLYVNNDTAKAKTISPLTLWDNAVLTIRQNASDTVSGKNESKLNNWMFRAYRTPNSANNLIGAGAMIDVDHASAFFRSLDPKGSANGYTLRVRNGGVFKLNDFRTTAAGNDDNGVVIDVNDSIFVPQNIFYFGNGTGLTSSPKIRVAGRRGEFYCSNALTLGSDNGVTAPLTIELDYPANGFEYGRFTWHNTDSVQADTLIGAPLASSLEATVGRNVKFKIDLTRWFAANPNLVVVPILRANLSRTEQKYLTVPGVSGGRVTDKAALQGWYASNFEIVGVDKDAFELLYDAASSALKLIRKGAWDLSDELTGFIWDKGVDGRWGDNSRWDLGRVPNSANHYVAFRSATEYGGLSKPITVDLENNSWDIQSLDLTGTIDLIFKNGNLKTWENSTSDDKAIRVRQDSSLKLDNVRFTSEKSLWVYTAGGDGMRFEADNSSFGSSSKKWSFFGRSSSGGHYQILQNPVEYIFRNGSYVGGFLQERGVFEEGATDADGKPLRSKLLVDHAQLTLDSLGVTDMDILVTGEGAKFQLVKPGNPGSNTSQFQGQSANQPYGWDRPTTWTAADGAQISFSHRVPLLWSEHGSAGIVGQVFIASNAVFNVGDFYLSDAEPLDEQEKSKFTHPEYCRDNALRFYGENAQMNSSGNLRLGYDETASVTQAGAPELSFKVPLKGYARAPLQAAGDVDIRNNLKLQLDVSEVVVTAEDVPLIAGQTMTVDSNIYNESKPGNLGTNVEITYPAGMTAETCPVSLKFADNTLYLTVASGSKTLVQVPTVESKTWTGGTLKADIESTDEYVVLENNGGEDVGSYNVVLQLRNETLYAWDDGEPGASRTIKFSIVKAENKWTTAPGISLPYWNIGGDPVEGPGVLVENVASRYGVVEVTKSWEGSGMPTALGSYSVQYVVSETPNYTSLKETISFTIYEDGTTPTGPVDTKSSDYIWKFNGNGYWTVADNWLGDEVATFGYPSANLTADPIVLATARFTSQYYDQPVKVTSPMDIRTGAVRFELGAHPVTLAFPGKALTVDEISLENVSINTLANGTYSLGTVAFKMSGATLGLDDGASATVTTLSFTDASGDTVERPQFVVGEGSTLTLANALNLGTSSSTPQGARLVLAGGQIAMDSGKAVSFGTYADANVPGAIVISGAADSEVGLVTTAAGITLGSSSYAAGRSSDVNVTFPQGGFATAPIRATGTASTATIKVDSGIRFVIDARNLDAGTYALAESAGDMTVNDLDALNANGVFRTKTGMKAVLVKEGNVLGVKVTNLGLTLTLKPSEVFCNGSSQKTYFENDVQKIVEDSEGATVSDPATFEFRINGGEWASDLTESEWTNPGVIHVRATVEGYANRPTATFTIRSRGLILFFSPAD